MEDNVIIDRAFEAGSASHMEDDHRRTFFMFMTNMTVQMYINERRIMQAFNRLLQKDEFDLDQEDYDIAGVTRKQTYIEKFLRILNIDPQTAFDKKKDDLILPMRTWEMISEEAKNASEELLDEESMVKTKFGIPAIQFAEAIVAQNLQNYYKLNDMESDLAFNIAKNNSFSFEETFEYVYNYVWKHIEKPELCETIRDEKIEKDLLRKDVLHMYFNSDQSMKNIRALLYLKDTEEPEMDLMTMTKKECEDIAKGYYDMDPGESPKTSFEEEYPTFEDYLMAWGYDDFYAYGQEDQEYDELMELYELGITPEGEYYSDQSHDVYDYALEMAEKALEEERISSVKKLPEKFEDLDISEEAAEWILHEIEFYVYKLPKSSSPLNTRKKIENKLTEYDKKYHHVNRLQERFREIRQDVSDGYLEKSPQEREAMLRKKEGKEAPRRRRGSYF